MPLGGLGQKVPAASGALFKLLAKGFRAGWPGIAIKIRDDAALAIAMLIAEMRDGCYQPIAAVRLYPMRDVARGQQSAGFRELRACCCSLQDHSLLWRHRRSSSF